MNNATNSNEKRNIENESQRGVVIHKIHGKNKNG